MATVRTYKTVSSSVSPFEGPLSARTPTSYKITDGSAVTTWTGTNITYDAAGVPISGTLNGFVMKIGSATVATFSGANASIATFGYDQSGADIIFRGGDIFYGHTGADLDINLGLGNDTYYARAGNDTLSEQGTGYDKMYGEAGNDTLRAGAGNDTLTGGAGQDKLYGELGADRFVFNSISESARGAARDTIFDFSHAQGDRIDLSAIDANGTASGNGTFSFVGSDPFGGTRAELRYASGVLSGDVNGDRVADFEIRVIAAVPLVKADIIL